MTREGSRERVPPFPFVGACVVSVASGLLVAVFIHVEGAFATACLLLWMLGPLLAGAILRTWRAWPYAVVAALWWAMLPISAALGLIGVGEGVDDSSGREFLVMFTLGALPFVTAIAGFFSYLVGRGLRRRAERRSGHGVEN